MSDRFRAFSFVDRIREDEPGVRIRGEYRIPASLGEFPPSLVAEAIGQLAAWSSLEAVDYRVRPVAGIAGEVVFESAVRPGDLLELEADLSQADEEAVAYNGLARIGGRPAVRLADCLGPMVPLEDFDDPEAVRRRRGQLVDGGAEPGAFQGVPEIAIERTGGEPGELAEGLVRVPGSAPFFGDHFPRRPVFPGTLLMDANLRLAAELASERGASSAPWRPRSVRDVKIRAFTPPGETLELKARVEAETPSGLLVAVETRRGKRTTSSARVLLSQDAP